MKPIALIKDDFKNLLDYHEWVNDTFNNLSKKNISHKPSFTKQEVERNINWYGKGTTYKELSEGVKQYQNPELLEKLYHQVSDELSTVIAQKLQARKLKFNALGFGMFCFDRAAMTLYKTKVSESSQTLKVKTNTKELFAYFPEVSREKHAVEFFISCNASASVKAEEMLYGGVSAVIMAELLIKAGIKVKINILIGSALNQDREKYIASLIPVKEYDEPLDRNLLALLSSDPRFMRFEAFKGLISSYEYFNMETPGSLGSPMNAYELKVLLEDSGYTKKLQSNHRFYFGGTFSESEALEKINNTIETIADFLKP
ncbi:MAG: hypothetical protein H0U95_15355 [Bacteroidetes bacterium]|nr:hypothetical protein [Bacteroidota bacterium]